MTSWRISSGPDRLVRPANPSLKGERLFERVVAALTQIALDVRRVTRFIGVFEDEAVFCGISIQSPSAATENSPQFQPWVIQSKTNQARRATEISPARFLSSLRDLMQIRSATHG